jgi:hypothetical protein
VSFLTTEYAAVRDEILKKMGAANRIMEITLLAIMGVANLCVDVVLQF